MSIITLWSLKGGQGVTTTAAAVGLTMHRAGHEVLLVDLAGDLPPALGLPHPDTPGLAEWIDVDDVGPKAIHNVLVDVVPGLRLLPLGRRHHLPTDTTAKLERTNELIAFLADSAWSVVVDAGRLEHGGNQLQTTFAVRATTSLLVTRACYLALSRANDPPLRPSGVVLVDEPGRALDRDDVERVVGVPVRAEVAIDPAVARAVDAGLLASRLPKTLQRALRSAA